MTEAQKSGRGKADEAKSHKDPNRGSSRIELISYKEAKELYQLELPDFRYIGLPAMKGPSERSYTKKELLDVVAKRDAFRQTAGEERQALKAATAVVRQQLKEAWQKDCTEIVAGWSKSTLKNLKHSSSSTLPLDLWTTVLEALCNDMELEGVRGPSVVARDIANAALVSKEVYAASLPAFQRLGSLCRPISSSLAMLPCAKPWEEGDAIWDRYMLEPTTISALEHRGPCRILGVSASQPKAIMVVEVLRKLHMVRPSPAPARLVIAVAMERHETLCDLVEMCAELTELDHHQEYHYSCRSAQKFGRHPYCGEDKGCSAFRLRQDCIRHGITSLESLKAAFTALLEPAADNEIADLLNVWDVEGQHLALEDLDDGEDDDNAG